MIKIFEEVQAWVDNKFILKIKACDQKRANCRAVAERQEAFKALLILSNESKNKTPIYLGEKKYAVQVAAAAASTTLALGPVVSSTPPKLESFGVSLSVTAHIFADTQAHGMYEEFLNTDENI